ncbi:MAG: molybdopterin-dependent oxidoreductase [Pseudomonadota bacterium]
MTLYRTATQWGVYHVEVEDGQIVGVRDHKADPDPSPLGNALVDGIQHPLRIKRPSVRRGWLESRERSKRGRDEFVEVPWDETLDMAAAEIRRVIDEWGNTSIFAGSYGWAAAGRFNHAQSQLHRFINLVGGCTRAMNSYSTAAAQVILPHVVAPWHEVELQQPNWREIADGCELFVAFGGLPLRNTQVAYGGITEHQSKPGLRTAAERGVRFINISPVRGDAPDWLDCEWVSIRPGTDVALMLGISYVLDNEGLTDRHFLKHHCVGYDRLRSYLMGETDGQPKSPEWASTICDVPVDVIQRLARQMAGCRTLVAAAWSLQRAHHGEQPFWMTVALAAMLGGIGGAGTGFGFGYGAEGFVGSAWRRFNWATHPKGMNPTRFAIPVSRIADMLLNPGETIDYDGQQITFPDVRLVYWAGGNPFHHHQDLNRLVDAWSHPDTVIVNEPWWTPIARFADIVFPATTQLERVDLCASSHDPYAHFMEAAIPPQHDARSDHLIFRGLAKRLGVQEAFTEGRSEMDWLRNMWERSAKSAQAQGFNLPDFDEFVEAKEFKIPEENDRPPWLAGFRRDPEAEPLNSTPSGKIELYSETIAGFNYDDCLGHPAWMEPIERLGGAGAEKHPLHLISSQPSKRLHSQLDHAKWSQDAKLQGKEVMTMHPKAAQARSIKDGMLARVFNDRGACLVGVTLSSDVREDVVVLATGAWFDPDFSSTQNLEQNGNPNVLTPDIGTSKLAQGPSSSTCLVQVEAYTE